MASDKNFEKLVSHRYDDIIELERPVSQKHTHMSLYDRAAQFSPFAALTGYEGVIDEQARFTDSDMCLDESSREKIDRKLGYVIENIRTNPEISVKCYVPDERKTGGTFITLRGNVRKIDEYERTILFSDGRKADIDSIRDIVLDKSIESHELL